uniref:Uncharacterized protein n=1 Tax=Romanomermis culicivorax TaxID=13658 RepID=A0A915HSC9_ROMCU
MNNQNQTRKSWSSNNVRKMARSTDKSKGLRHFSTKVCEKVREKGVTNYNEVADELVQEYFESSVIDSNNNNNNQEKQLYDQKNIRRRVYDALNVLMAMNIITKEKKEIKWVGLPTSTVQERQKLVDEKLKLQERIKQKAELLQDSIIQLVATKSLIERNKMMENAHGRPPSHTILSLPYVVVTTDKKTEVDCSISPDNRFRSLNRFREKLRNLYTFQWTELESESKSPFIL